MDISAYNVQGYLHRLEHMTKYEFPFERLKYVENQYKKDPEEEKEEEKKEEGLE